MELPASINKPIAIIHTWPDVRNAEYEVVQRLISAAANINQSVVLIDNFGIVLWCSLNVNLAVGGMLPANSVRYIISLHFNSPRVLDFYSYYAIWQPIEFYYDFNYSETIEKLSTHNDLLSCDSDLADAHAFNLFKGYGREPLMPLIRLFHAPAQPYLTPNITEEATLFYIGINWERLGRAKGRFHDTLVALDQQGLTNIYGPSSIMGVSPWEGFQTYKGELPFDGRSVLRAINRAGICLALSSPQHQATGIMSNRLFEGFAGGAAVIATPNPIIDKYFADCVYLVDDSRGEEILGQMIVEAVREIRNDRAEAMRRARAGQKIVAELCSLEDSLTALADNHDARLAHFENQVLAADAEITIILCDDHGSVALLRDRLSLIGAQKYCKIDLHLICDSMVAAQIGLELITKGAIRHFEVHAATFVPRADRFDGIRRPAERSGPIVSRIVNAAQTPFFALVGTADIPFSDHFASLARTLQDGDVASFAASGIILQTRDTTGRTSRTLGSLRFEEQETLLLVNGPLQRGRFLFRTGLVQSDDLSLMTLLDGEEVRLFQLTALLEGDLAQTSYASLASDQTIDMTPRAVAEPSPVQQQYIRDRFRSNARWLTRIAQQANVPEFVHAYAPGAPVRWRDFTLPGVRWPKLELNQMVAVRKGAPGVEHLGAGFSFPETDHVWLASDRGVIDFELDTITGATAPDREIVLLVAGRRSIVTGRAQHCTVVLNGTTIAYVPLLDYAHEVHISIPSDLMRKNSLYRLELVPDHSEVASEADPRYLSLSLMGIGVFSRLEVLAATIKIGQIYSCGTGQVGADALVRGFYHPEPEFCWIAGLTGEVYLSVSGVLKHPALLLNVRVRDSASGDHQQLALSLNKRLLAKLKLPNGHHRVVLPLGDTDVFSYMHLQLGVAHAEVTKDADGRIIDGRLLGCAVWSFGVVDASSYADLVRETDGFRVDDGAGLI